MAYSVSHLLEIFWKYYKKCKEHGIEETIISSLVVTENIDLNL